MFFRTVFTVHVPNVGEVVFYHGNECVWRRTNTLCPYCRRPLLMVIPKSPTSEIARVVSVRVDATGAHRGVIDTMPEDVVALECGPCRRQRKAEGLTTGGYLFAPIDAVECVGPIISW